MFVHRETSYIMSVITLGEIEIQSVFIVIYII